jgi:hypothetical protein
MDVKWIGLRPSQVEALELPSQVFKIFSKNDRKKAQALQKSAFIQVRFYEM